MALFRNLVNRVVTFCCLGVKPPVSDQVLSQLPIAPPKALQLERTREMHEAEHHHHDLSLKDNLENFSAVMWKDIVEVNSFLRLNIPHATMNVFSTYLLLNMKYANDIASAGVPTCNSWKKIRGGNQNDVPNWTHERRSN